MSIHPVHKNRNRPNKSQSRKIMTVRDSMPSLPHRRKHHKIFSKSREKHKPKKIPKHLVDKMDKMSKKMKNIGYRPPQKGKFKDYPISLSRKIKPLRPGASPSLRVNYLDSMKAIDNIDLAEIDVEQLKRDNPELYKELKREISNIFKH